MDRNRWISIKRVPAMDQTVALESTFVLFCNIARNLRPNSANPQTHRQHMHMSIFCTLETIRFEFEHIFVNNLSIY